MDLPASKLEKSSSSGENSLNQGSNATAAGSTSEEYERDINLANKMAMPYTEEHLQSLDEAFCKFDTNGDNKISQDEFYEIMKQCDWSEKTSNNIFKLNDTDGDGQLDRFEFVNIFLKAPTHCTEKENITKPDFVVKDNMIVTITQLLERDNVLAQRWGLVLREMVPQEYRHDLRQLDLLYEKISRTLDCWVSSQSSKATFSRLVQIIKEHSLNTAESLEQNRDIIKDRI